VIQGRFCSGFSQTTVFRRGIFVVILWWMRGKNWCFDGHFSEMKSTPAF
jgi:hypothetical protein